jgi:predicted transcriptional regulator
MTRQATTFRLDPDVQAGLALLSKVQGRTQNQLVNEAVRDLVSRRAREVSVDLETTLARLKAHRRTDPTGEQSMAAAMEAEAAIEHDPAEGVRVQRNRPPGPATARVLQRLRG